MVFRLDHDLIKWGDISTFLFISSDRPLLLDGVLEQKKAQNFKNKQHQIIDATSLTLTHASF